MIISNHAKLQMKERNISEKLIYQAISNPEQIITTDEGRTVFHLRIKSKRYLLRVIAEQTDSDWLIITVYRTTKIKKYWEGEIGES